MKLIHVGLVDKTGNLDPAFVRDVADALNVQALQDLSVHWPVKATVQHLPSPDLIPVDVWPIFLVDSLPPGEGGFHMDQHNQPYAKVRTDVAVDEWTVAASHELCEMLVDPFGNRMQSSRAIKIEHGDVVDAPGQFSYLVESADPCEALEYSYNIHGIAVSDFITPNYYDPVKVSGRSYSFTGAIQRPRQILPGGYISYVNLETNTWEQIIWNGIDGPLHRTLGIASNARSMRLWIDNQTRVLANQDQERRAAPHLATISSRSNLNDLAAIRAAIFN